MNRFLYFTSRRSKMLKGRSVQHVDTSEEFVTEFVASGRDINEKVCL